MKRPVKRSGGGFYAYIVECADGAYYAGYTNDLERRVKEHNESRRRAKCLRGKLPVKLVWSKEYRYLTYAMRTEYKIKQLNRRQKELLISGVRLDKVLGRSNKTAPRT